MKRLPGSGRYWLIGPTLVLALLAGCTQPQKSGTAKSPTAQAERKAPAPQPGSPAAVKPAHKAQAEQAAPAQQAKPADKKAASAKPSASAAEPLPGPEAAAPAAGVADATKKEGCCPSDSKKEVVDLTPPPADQPQPKLVCKQTKIVSDPVWQGKEGAFTFTISNEGEAPLAIRVKPT